MNPRVIDRGTEKDHPGNKYEVEVAADAPKPQETWVNLWVNPDVHPTWQDDVARQLGEAEADVVHAALSGGKDFHFWFRKSAGTGLKWKLVPIMVHENPNWKDQMMAQLTSAAWDARIVGFNNADHNAIWILRRTK
jgi:hypothetical protein